MPSGTAPGGNMLSVGTAISMGGSSAFTFSACGLDSPCGRSAALAFRICPFCAVCVGPTPVASSGRAGRPVSRFAFSRRAGRTAACLCSVLVETARGAVLCATCASGNSRCTAWSVSPDARASLCRARIFSAGSTRFACSVAPINSSGRCSACRVPPCAGVDAALCAGAVARAGACAM